MCDIIVTGVLISLIALESVLLATPRGETTISSKDQKLSSCKLISCQDGLNMWAYQLRWAQSLQEKKLEPEAVKAMIEQIVDEHAKAKVDLLVDCVFWLPWGTSNAGFKTFNRAPHRGFRTAYPDIAPAMEDFDQTYDLVKILLERSRKNGMAFLGGLRMNDRHPNSDKQSFYTDHPEWRLKSFRAMDYKHEGVRHAVLAVTAEFLDRYDVDGVELDWMRWCHVFEPSEAVDNAPILTDFMAKLRKRLDEQALKRGRDMLLLGVRVPQTIEECRDLGFDIKAWAQSGLVDYICPSDFHCIDFNIKVEDFVRLTTGTNCKVYPTVFGTISIEGARRRGLTHEQFRAAAKNYDAYGAAGVSSYNFYTQFRIFAGNEFGQAPAESMLTEWPRALHYLTALRDPKALAHGDRHYLYYPLHPGKATTGAWKHQIIELTRSQDSPSASTRLRFAEDLKSPHLSATLDFKVTGMVEGDQMEVHINSQTVPAERIERRYDADGQLAEQGRPLPAFYRYRIPLSSPPAKFGDNELQLRLTKSGGTETLIAQEFEVLVQDSQSQ